MGTFKKKDAHGHAPKLAMMVYDVVYRSQIAGQPPTVMPYSRLSSVMPKATKKKKKNKKRKRKKP